MWKRISSSILEDSKKPLPQIRLADYQNVLQSYIREMSAPSSAKGEVESRGGEPYFKQIIEINEQLSLERQLKGNLLIELNSLRESFKEKVKEVERLEELSTGLKQENERLVRERDEAEKRLQGAKEDLFVQIAHQDELLREATRRAQASELAKNIAMARVKVFEESLAEASKGGRGARAEAGDSDDFEVVHVAFQLSKTLEKGKAGRVEAFATDGKKELVALRRGSNVQVVDLRAENKILGQVELDAGREVTQMKITGGDKPLILALLEGDELVVNCAVSGKSLGRLRLDEKKNFLAAATPDFCFLAAGGQVDRVSLKRMSIDGSAKMNQPLTALAALSASSVAAFLADARTVIFDFELSSPTLDAYLGNSTPFVRVDSFEGRLVLHAPGNALWILEPGAKIPRVVPVPPDSIFEGLSLSTLRLLVYGSEPAQVYELSHPFPTLEFTTEKIAHFAVLNERLAGLWLFMEDGSADFYIQDS